MSWLLKFKVILPPILKKCPLFHIWDDLKSAHFHLNITIEVLQPQTSCGPTYKVITTTTSICLIRQMCCTNCVQVKSENLRTNGVILENNFPERFKLHIFVSTGRILGDHVVPFLLPFT